MPTEEFVPVKHFIEIYIKKSFTEDCNIIVDVEPNFPACAYRVVLRCIVDGCKVGTCESIGWDFSTMDMVAVLNRMIEGIRKEYANMLAGRILRGVLPK